MADRAEVGLTEKVSVDIGIRPGELVVGMLMVRICSFRPGSYWGKHPKVGGSPESLWMSITARSGPIVSADYGGAMWEAVRYGRAGCASLLHHLIGAEFFKHGHVDAILSPVMIRLLGKWKSAHPEWLLKRAAAGNNVSGMRTARKLGAKYFQEALWTAEDYGCREAYLKLSLWIDSE